MFLPGGSASGGHVDFTPRNPSVTVSPGTGASRTPLEMLEGIITPSGLHYERHHNGVPDIDPAQHELLIHGMVKRPLAFSVDALMRYPMETHFRFIECAGNSGGYNQAQPPQATSGEINGLLSGSEWTGVRLATLLKESGVAPGAKWVIAEGADAAAMSRSIPLEKCMDDAVIALFQNGEAIRPEQGDSICQPLDGILQQATAIAGAFQAHRQIVGALVVRI